MVDIDDEMFVCADGVDSFCNENGWNIGFIFSSHFFLIFFPNMSVLVFCVKITFFITLNRIFHIFELFSLSESLRK